MSPGLAAGLFGVAIVAGFCGSLLGVGGGVFIVPAMVILFHLPVKTAIAASVVSVIATSNAGGSAYVDQHITNIRLGMVLEVATTAGALVGALLAVHVHPWLLMLAFAALLAFMAYASFATRRSDDERIARDAFATATQDRLARFFDLRGSYHDEAAGKEVAYVVTGSAVGLVVAGLAGIASGLLGIGGGVLKVSAMNTSMNVPMKVAVGTSKLMIGITAAVSALLFLGEGLVPFAVVGPVALGTSAGAWAGTAIMNRLHTVWLKRLFSVLMAYLAYEMVGRGLAEGLGLHVRVLP